MKKTIIISLAIALILFLGALSLGQSKNDKAFVAIVSGAADRHEIFSRALGPRNFEFPQDFGPHSNYQTEWWYFTGNLQTDQGRHFGYQLTFFRRALAADEEIESRASSWASQHIMMAHLALTDTDNQRFFAFERFSREGANLAGVKSLPFQIWLEDWRIEQTISGDFQLIAASGEIAIELTLNDTKGPTLQGQAGYSQKGPEPGEASYYYSQSRLQSQGYVTLGNESYAVSGTSWIDHEFSTGALSEGQIGWDWFSIQLEDQRELMLFQLRRSDGSIDPHSAAIIIDADGSTRSFQHGEFFLQPEGVWQSPHSGARYPSKWTIQIPSEYLELQLTPMIDDQELNLSFIYWEGAVRVEGSIQGQEVHGMGYIEMTGYASSMEGQF